MLQLSAARTGWRRSISGNPSRTNVFQGSAGCGVAVCLRGANLPAIIKIEEEKSFPMQKRAPALGFFAFAVACALILAACGGGSGGTSTVTSVAITPTTATVPLNGTTEFTAVVNLTNSSTSTSTSTVVTWKVNGVAGGNTTTGTIVSSTTDEQVGVTPLPESCRAATTVWSTSPQSRPKIRTPPRRQRPARRSPPIRQSSPSAQAAAWSSRNKRLCRFRLEPTPICRNTERSERPERDVVGQFHERR